MGTRKHLWAVAPLLAAAWTACVGSPPARLAFGLMPEVQGPGRGEAHLTFGGGVVPTIGLAVPVTSGEAEVRASFGLTPTHDRFSVLLSGGGSLSGAARAALCPSLGLLPRAATWDWSSDCGLTR